MPRSLVDIETDTGGDLVVDGSGDLKLTTPFQSLIQDVIFRVRTNQREFTPHPGFGADLITLVGEGNNRRTVGRIQQQVWAAITQDARFRGHDIDVIAFPANREQVGVVVSIRTKFTDRTPKQLQVSFSLNLVTGDMESITV